MVMRLSGYSGLLNAEEIARFRSESFQRERAFLPLTSIGRISPNQPELVLLSSAAEPVGPLCMEACIK